MIALEADLATIRLRRRQQRTHLLERWGQGLTGRDEGVVAEGQRSRVILHIRRQAPELLALLDLVLRHHRGRRDHATGDQDDHQGISRLRPHTDGLPPIARGPQHVRAARATSLAQRALDEAVGQPRHDHRGRDDGHAEQRLSLGVVARVRDQDDQQRPVPQVQGVGDPAQELHEAALQEAGDTHRLPVLPGQDHHHRAHQREQRARAREGLGAIHDQAGGGNHDEAQPAEDLTHPRVQRRHDRRRRLLAVVGTRHDQHAQQATQPDLPEAGEGVVVVHGLVLAVLVGREGERKNRDCRENDSQGLAGKPSENERDQGDRDQGSHVDLQLRGHAPQVLERRDRRAGGVVITARKRQLPVRDVRQRTDRVLGQLQVLDPRHEQQPGCQRRADDHREQREEPPDDAHERLNERQTLRVARIRELGAKEEHTSQQKEDIHARGHLAHEDVENHHEGDRETA